MRRKEERREEESSEPSEPEEAAKGQLEWRVSSATRCKCPSTTKHDIYAFGYGPDEDGPWPIHKDHLRLFNKVAFC